jgi:hypothetical protein
VSETPKVVLQPLGDPGLVCEGDVCDIPAPPAG